jgi:hypothetical protein
MVRQSERHEESLFSAIANEQQVLRFAQDDKS